MKRLILFLALMVALPVAAQDFGHGSSGKYKIVSDTTGVDKSLGRMYFYTGDSTLYFGDGTYLDRVSVMLDSLYARMLIVRDSVGIGTTAPESQLHIEKAGAGPVLTLTGKTDANADATLLLSRAGATAVQGLKFRYDAATADGYIDNLYNNNNGDIFIRTKTAGTPVNAVIIAGSGKVTLADTMVAAGLRSEGPSRLKGEVTAGATATPVVINAGGTVGINTTVPGSKLEVYGNKSTDTLLSVYNDKTGLTTRDSSFVVLPTGQTNVSVTGSAIGLSIYGNKTTGNLAQFINDNNGAVGDSTVQITPTGGISFSGGLTGKSGNTLTNVSSGVWQLGAYSNSFYFGSSAIEIGYLGLRTNTGSDVGIINEKSSGAGSVYIGTDNVKHLWVKTGGSVGIGTSAPRSNSLTLGTKATQRDVIVTRENTPAGTDSSLRAYVLAGNGRYVAKATDADSAWLTVDADSARLRSNNPWSIAGGITNTGTLAQKGTATFSVPTVCEGATRYVKVVSLADGAQQLLPTGVAGFGQVKATGAWCMFHFAADGTVTLEDHVSGSTTEDNDTTLNVFDDGSGIGIENELGSTLNVLIDITYYTP